MTAPELQATALDRARSGQSLMNYAAIITGFLEKGIPAADIKPRENVFTFAAWKALGRSVKRGEHGVKVLTFVPMRFERQDAETGETTARAYSRPRTTTVFHVSQTEENRS